MKKLKYFLILLVPIFFIVLSGCSDLAIHTTSNSYSPSGLVAVVKGKATKASKLTYGLDGKQHTVKMNDGHFAFSVPVSSSEQDIKITASDGQQQVTKIITIRSAKPIADYTSLAQEYNYYALSSGSPTDQIPLVAQDGIFKYTRPNGTVFHFNVQGSYLMGISVYSSLSNMKSKNGMKDFETSLYSMSSLIGADSKSVLKNLNKQLKNAKDGNSSNMKQISSNGIHYNINLATNGIYIYITK
ncbi:hypothetical protein [Companilactobacillus sp.]|jgi:hypothetical protein|uniref:hypothetical protein n=1 Tax=Companilactobacillus sp. TaxID=2767905 RepID=UPI0025C17F6E|nr:hypothetical protein [Companilactobacillus sp.]MCH4008334.1 hypothetical protein [Companilactobacillus sp.]MCH4051487.1 hypothetical protein [Companilactobacillus sp.]MCH4076277.1 hypothetical protein [Companilactobacillus sp.]MCH4124852.1 hypothetical protein [Companilactobacillus sp.]MCH4131394.1 hypothetical protein [Companilactobacillus sp.]